MAASENMRIKQKTNRLLDSFPNVLNTLFKVHFYLF